MKHHILLILIFSVILFSCSPEKPQIQITEQATPEVLIENEKSVLDISSKRYSQDIIQQLYNEALENDPELQELNESLRNFEKVKPDSLKPVYNYISNKRSYWSAAFAYIDNITDSTLKSEMRSAFRKLEEKSQNDFAQHQNALDQLEAKTRSIKDHELLLNLLVTYELMNRYEQNELPPIQTITNQINQSDQHLTEMKGIIDQKR